MNPLLLALIAYVWWGLVPAYWKQLPSFHAEELILYRVLLSSLSLLPVILWRGEGRRILENLQTPRFLLGCLASSLLIGFNWYLYIWAIANGHIVESSLGYFLNPLVNVALGMLLLKETMNSLQKLACALAGLGVLALTLQTHTFPWISILLALSFGFYGFARKVLRFPTLAATFSETVVLSVPSAVLLAWMYHRQTLHVSGAPSGELWWLLASGLITTVPLLAFAEAAKHLPLTVMGFFQFCSPTLQFLLGVFAYHEPFGVDRWICFGVIWLGLGVFAADLAQRSGFACSRGKPRK